jgi:hypothetical protein
MEYTLLSIGMISKTENHGCKLIGKKAESRIASQGPNCQCFRFDGEESESRRAKKTTKTRRHKEKQIVAARTQLSKFEE